jgi:hypothetical protein
MYSTFNQEKIYYPTMYEKFEESNNKVIKLSLKEKYLARKVHYKGNLFIFLPPSRCFIPFPFSAQL